MYTYMWFCVVCRLMFVVLIINEMSENKIVKVFNDFGVYYNIPEDDFEVVSEYFSREWGSESDEDSSSDESAPELLDFSEVSIPVENINQSIGNIEDIIIQLEAEEPASVINENDGGDNLVLGDSNNLLETGQALSEQDPQVIVANFLEKGCGCKIFNNNFCSKQFTVQELTVMRDECSQLDYYENNVNKLDQLVLGQLRCLTNDREVTARTHKIQNIRKFSRTKFLLKGLNVCKNMYLFAHQIKIKRFKRLTKHYNDVGLISKSHGNSGRCPSNKTPFQSVELIVKFIRNYAEQHAVFLPGRIPAIKNAYAKILPTSDTKKTVYNKYCDSLSVLHEKPVSIRVFSSIWRQTCGDVVIMKPKYDLCKICQSNYTSLNKLLFSSETEKLENISAMRSHLEFVAKERDNYRNVIKNSKDEFQLHNSSRSIPNSCSFSSSIHYSFDMAQQVHIPSNPLQPGPLYFLTPFKVGIFGIMCETINKQYNYLIPESTSVCKGANLIVSLFDSYLKNFSHGEKVMYIHADNCVAQNKNNILMAYLAWRVGMKFNQKIILSFLPVGHTKFSCDWAFGLLKKKFKNRYVSSISELAEVVEESTATSKINSAVLVGNEKGEVNIKVYDWQDYFHNQGWKRVPNITKYIHFEFNEEWTGKVSCKTALDGVETLHELTDKDTITDCSDLQEMTPVGLSKERKKYLYDNIRPYCKEEFKDLLCGSVEEEEENENLQEQPQKRKRRKMRKD